MLESLRKMGADGDVDGRTRASASGSGSVSVSGAPGPGQRMVSSLGPAALPIRRSARGD
jgi:hypothetical protein